MKFIVFLFSWFIGLGYLWGVNTSLITYLVLMYGYLHIVKFDSWGDYERYVLEPLIVSTIVGFVALWLHGVPLGQYVWMLFLSSGLMAFKMLGTVIGTGYGSWLFTTRVILYGCCIPIGFMLLIMLFGSNAQMWVFVCVFLSNFTMYLYAQNRMHLAASFLSVICISLFINYFHSFDFLKGMLPIFCITLLSVTLNVEKRYLKKKRGRELFYYPLKIS